MAGLSGLSLIHILRIGDMRRMKIKSNWNLGCSLVLVVVLAASFLFYLWAQKLGKYTLQPGESVNFTVNPRIQDVEYYSELILSLIHI